MTHGHRDFTVCSCSSLPVLSPGVPTASALLPALTCSTTAVMSGEPVMRSARANARRRIAASRHCWSGCNQAPRPGSFLAKSTVTAHSPFPPTATTRSSSTASSRFRQPTHVRTGPTGLSGLRPCAEAEVSRWITAQSTVTVPAIRNGCAGRCWDYRSCTAPCVASGFGSGLFAGTASLRMSIRQPVSRAASRAFWPSLPIASDS
jgi:hypothetical protein